MGGRAEFKLQCIKLKLIAQAIISYDIRKKSKSWILYLGTQNRCKDDPTVLHEKINYFCL